MKYALASYLMPLFMFREKKSPFLFFRQVRALSTHSKNNNFFFSTANRAHKNN